MCQDCFSIDHRRPVQTLSHVAPHPFMDAPVSKDIVGLCFNMLLPFHCERKVIHHSHSCFGDLTVYTPLHNPECPKVEFCQSSPVKESCEEWLSWQRSVS